MTAGAPMLFAWYSTAKSGDCMKVAMLNQTNPAHDAAKLADLRALYSGQWRHLAPVWLPTTLFEPPDLCAERRRLAHYDNHVGGVLDLVSSMVTEAPPKLVGLPSDYGETIDANADGCGTSMEVWARLWLTDATNMRTAYAWIDRPNVMLPEGASRADEESAGALKPWLRSIDADCVLDWSDTSGAMEWILFREVTTRRTSPATARVPVWTWTCIDATSIRRWEWVGDEDNAAPKPEDDVAELPAVAHGMGRCPVVRLDLGAGLWLGERMREPALALFSAVNDRDWCLHRASSELLVIASASEVATPKQGQGYWLQLRRDDKGADTAQMIGPSGVAFKALATRERSREVTLYRVVQQLALAADVTTSTRSQSGESKARDWTPTERLLSGIATVLRDALVECGKLLAIALGDRRGTSEITVEGLDAFNAADLDDALKAAALSVEAKAGSPSFVEAVAKIQARRVLRNVEPEVLERIDEELEAAREGYGQETGAGVEDPETDDEPTATA